MCPTTATPTPSPAGSWPWKSGSGRLLNRGCAMGVEGVDRLETPGLTLGPLGLGPGDDLVVRSEQQAGAGVAQLDAVASRLPYVQKECLLDRVLVRPGLDVDSRVEEDVGGTEDVARSEERRVGKECRCRWSSDQ